MNLTENDNEIIKHLGYPKKVNLSIGSFYIKLVGSERALKELLGSEIANQMGLISPRSKIVMVDEKEYLLSEDLASYGKFINAEDMEIGDLIEEHCSLKEAYEILENKYHIGSEIKNLIKIYIFDIIFKHFDRNKRNWGVIFLPDKANKLVILDNEYLLVDNNRKEKLKFYFSPTIPFSLEEDFASFLELGNPEDISLFSYYFNLYTPEFIEKLIEQLIKRNGLNVEEKGEIIKAYKDHYFNLLKIFLNKYKEKKERI